MFIIKFTNGTTVSGFETVKECKDFLENSTVKYSGWEIWSVVGEKMDTLITLGY